MASRFENRRYGRGRDREDNQGWGSRGGSYSGQGGSNYGREDDYSRRDRQRFGQGGSSYSREFGEGYGRGSDRENQRDAARTGRDYGRENYGYDEGGHGYAGSSGYRSDQTEDLSGGGMYGGGIGGYSGGGYQGYTGGGTSNYGGANYGRSGSRGYEGRDYESGGRYGSDYPESERGYMSGRGHGGQGQEDRGWWDRTSDEVASWFGDEDAEQRREMDARQQGQHRGRGPRNYTRSDDRIKEDINDRLTDNDFLDASDIDVEVNDGEVVLSGNVDSRYAKRLAEDIAEDVSGVKNVENRIRSNQVTYGQSTTTTGTGSSIGTSQTSGTTGSTGTSRSTGSSTSATGTTSGTTSATGTSGTSGTTGTTGATAAKGRSRAAGSSGS